MLKVVVEEAAATLSAQEVILRVQEVNPSVQDQRALLEAAVSVQVQKALRDHHFRQGVHLHLNPQAVLNLHHRHMISLQAQRRQGQKAANPTQLIKINKPQQLSRVSPLQFTNLAILDSKQPSAITIIALNLRQRISTMTVGIRTFGCGYKINPPIVKQCGYIITAAKWMTNGIRS